MADKSSRKQQQEQARQERLARQQAAAAKQTRMKRLQIVVGTVLAAAVLVGLGFVLFSGQDTAERNVGGNVSTTESGVRGVQETRRLLQGVPQQGFTLGAEDAPVTLYSYLDYQCPFCAEFDLQAMPQIVDRLVRTGRLKVVNLPLDNIGDDSIRAAGVAQSLARKNRAYDFTHLFFFNQGSEGTGYATDEFLRNLVAEIPGAAPSDVTPDLSGDLRRLLQENQQQFAESGSTGTPSFEIARSGSQEREQLEYSGAEAFVPQLEAKVAELAGGAGGGSR